MVRYAIRGPRSKYALEPLGNRFRLPKTAAGCPTPVRRRRLRPKPPLFMFAGYEPAALRELVNNGAAQSHLPGSRHFAKRSHGRRFIPRHGTVWSGLCVELPSASRLRPPIGSGVLKSAALPLTSDRAQCTKGLHHLAPERGFIAPKPLEQAVVESGEPLEALR